MSCFICLTIPCILRWSLQCHTHIYIILHCVLHVGKQLHLVHSQVKVGAIYQVVPFSNKKLAISVNHAVCVLAWNDEQSALVEECSYQNNILSLFLKTKGDFILVSCSY